MSAPDLNPSHAESVALRTEPTGREALATPVGFAQGILGLSRLYDWQKNVLRDFERPGWVTLRCCNEAGKTTQVAAPLILWVLACFAGAQVVVTSGSWRQVKEQLFPALKRFESIFQGWEFADTKIKAKNGSRCVGFSTRDAGLFEGFHVGPDGHRDTPLLIIADEAKSINDPIFEAIDRCRPTWLLLMSSPGGSIGRFYRSHTKNRSLYRAHVARLGDCPHIDPATVQRIIATYGETHPYTQSTLYAEFGGEAGTGLVVPLSHWERCLRQPAAWAAGERHAFCDFAAGGDENVLALRHGNRITLEKCWREADTMRGVGEFIANFRRLGLTPQQITGDDDGLGTVMLDRMAELGWSINRMVANAKATDPAYFNRSAEVWGQGARQIERCLAILPDDELLQEQMTGRLWKRFSEGSLQLESKREMKLRGMGSPDRADAVLGCMQPLLSMLPQNYTDEHTAHAAWDQLEEYQRDAVAAGFNAGG